MAHLGCPGVTAAFAAAVVSGAAWAAAPAQQFRAGVDLVRLPVVVTARDGMLVRGLTASQFEVQEDGAPQTIVAFAEGPPGEAVPLHLGLLLDSSGSMDRDLRDAANAAVQFVTALEEAEDVTFVDFDSSIRVGRFEPPSYPRLFERIRAPQADGMTALYDAIAAYVRGAADRPGQHVLLLYTDGGDSASRLSYDQLMKMLRGGNVIVYALGYLEHQSTSVRATQEMRLTSLAHETGGEVFFPYSARELNSAYARILDELGSRYTIGYVSTNAKPDGRFRKVRVRLTSPEPRSARIRTRSGYLAPTPPDVR